MKHISEFDFTSYFPKIMKEGIVRTPEEYREYLLKNGYAYEVAPVIPKEEPIQPKPIPARKWK